MRNIENKWKPSNFDEIRELATRLKTGEAYLLQEDYYYENPKSGRLKLRSTLEGNLENSECLVLDNHKYEVIYYERPNSEVSKLSTYEIRVPPDRETAMKLVGNAKKIGHVSKQREVIFIGTTRVHFDRVEELGRFVEIEVVLSEDDSEDKGREIMNDLIEKLHLKADETVKCSYIDLITQ